MRYGILGGSFDPIHNGHIALALAAQAHLTLEEVFFVPNFKNPLKHQPHASPTQRLEMCQLALQEYPQFRVSDVELSRGGRSFASNTVEELVNVIPGHFWFLLGADALKGIKDWKSPQKLIKMCRLGAVTRPPEELSKVVAVLGQPYDEVIDEIPMTAKRISSSDIRDDIRRGLSPEMWIDAGVWEYIKKNGLYQE